LGSAPCFRNNASARMLGGARLGPKTSPLGYNSKSPLGYNSKMGVIAKKVRHFRYLSFLLKVLIREFCA
jgi:hypothetical protein